MMGKLHEALRASICAVVVSMLMVGNAYGTKYTVGDSSGWSLGGDYSTWASQYTFHVGDSLEFPYSAGSHTVVQVDQASYKACSPSNAITNDNSVGNTVVDLKSPGTYYFMCSMSGHCEGGMKFSIAVTASGSNGNATTPSNGNTPATPTTGDSPTTSSPNSATITKNMKATITTLIVSIASIYLVLV